MLEFWLIVLTAISIVGLICIGYCIGADDRDNKQAELDAQVKALRVQWAALERCRQADDVYFEARDAMRRVETEYQAEQPWPGVVDGEVVEVGHDDPLWWDGQDSR